MPKFSRTVFILLTCLFIAGTALFVVSCNKKGAAGNAKFLGTYRGTTCTDTVTSDIVVTAGATGNMISVNMPIDTGGCTTIVGVTGNVNGNNVTFGSQTFNDICGSVIVVSGTGQLNGNTLTLNLSGVYQLSGIIDTSAAAYCFTGTRQ